MQWGHSVGRCCRWASVRGGARRHALRHHCEIRHHVVLSEEGAQSSEQLTDFTSLFSDNFLVGKFGFQAPALGVVEGDGLRGGLFAAALPEQNIVCCVGVEGRIQVDEVNALGGDVLTQNVEIVAELELVGMCVSWIVSQGELSLLVSLVPKPALLLPKPRECSAVL